ncbi:2-oxoglutarate-dependent dioxygenase, partial [Lachnellula subtilissima]
MPSKTETETADRSGFYIPTIDISPYLRDPSSAASGEVVEMVRDACVGTGFFQITGHGIPTKIQEAVFAGSKAFFEMDVEEKKKLDRSVSVGASNRGYEVIGGQGLQEGMLPDLKEGFYIGHEIPATDPRVLAHAFLVGPNLWPPLPRAVFQDPMTAYFAAMYSLSLRVMELVAATLPYGKDVFKGFVGPEAVASVRLLHYPPGKEEGEGEGQLGAGAHTDFGAVTLLLQDGVGGLQVWDNGHGHGGKGAWVDVQPARDAYVVNVGDMLQMLTEGRYKSGLHRVVNRSGRDRYSVPFFFDGNVDFVLRPLGEEGEEGEGKGGEEMGDGRRAYEGAVW